MIIDLVQNPDGVFAPKVSRRRFWAERLAGVCEKAYIGCLVAGIAVTAVKFAVGGLV